MPDHTKNKCLNKRRLSQDPKEYTINESEPNLRMKVGLKPFAPKIIRITE
jgi:hypothetical protein